MNKKAEQRKATEAALLLALQHELVETALPTVEGIARRAGVNKVLIYRYFGGLPGLIEAFGSSEAFMPDAEEILSRCPADLASRPARERFLLCVQAYAHALARRPSTVRILLLLTSAPQEISEALRAGRKQAIEQVRAAFGRADEELPFDLDLAFNLLISGICVLLGNPRRHDDAQAQDSIEQIAERIASTLEGLILE